MPEFSYTARTISGEDIVGTISAGTKRETLLALAEQSLFPLHVESTEPAAPRWRLNARVKPSLVATNLNQLADLLQNGVSLMASLDILTEQATHTHLAEVLDDIRGHVAEGGTLDQAFAMHPDIFNHLTVSIVRAGSEGAFLEDALKRTANFLELQEELKGRLVSAMFYPAFLAVIGFVITVVLIVFFVPKFEPLFVRLQKQTGGLPGATVILLAISDVLGRFGLFLLALSGGMIVWIKRWIDGERGRLLVDRWKLKLPVAGKIILGSAVSRFCRVLGTLMQNGVPLLKALEISSDSTGNVVLSRAIRESAENISAGETLSQPLAECGLIPRPVMAMIRVAEESNNLEDVLVSIADTIDRTTARQLDMMLRLVEPAMLLIMGSVIMFVIVALLLPVFDMSAAMG